MGNSIKLGGGKLVVHLIPAILDVFKVRVQERGITLTAAITEAIGWWLDLTGKED